MSRGTGARNNPSSTSSKLVTLAEAAASVPNGATVALGGLSMNSAPMAFVRELVRAGKRYLTIVAIVAGMSVDWLIAAGCVRRVVAGLVSFEGYGLAPKFRYNTQVGVVAMEEYSEHLLICRLQAQARRLPFMPTVAGLGTDVIDLHRESGTIRVETDAATGRQFVACTPLAVDVAVVHAHEADTAGNARVNPKLLWMDSEIVNAAERTIVTAERIVDTDAFVAEPHRTSYPRFMVDAVCAAPLGAFPTSCFPDYGHNDQFFEDYVAASRSPREFVAFFNRRMFDAKTWEDFLAVNGVDLDAANGAHPDASADNDGPPGPDDGPPGQGDPSDQGGAPPGQGDPVGQGDPSDQAGAPSDQGGGSAGEGSAASGECRQ